MKSKQKQVQEIIKCGKEPVYFFNKYRLYLWVLSVIAENIFLEYTNHDNNMLKIIHKHNAEIILGHLPDEHKMNNSIKFKLLYDNNNSLNKKIKLEQRIRNT